MKENFLLQLMCVELKVYSSMLSFMHVLERVITAEKKRKHNGTFSKKG